MGPIRDWSGLEVLPSDVCWGLLAEMPVGRVAFVHAGEPVILTVNFGVDGQSVVFRTASGSKLDNAIMERPTAFEADAWDADKQRGWSVLVRGISTEVLDPAEVARLEALGVTPWAQAVPRDTWVRLIPTEITGRRITVSFP